MKKIFLNFVFMLLFCVPCFAKVQIEILKVYDGDSVLARIENNVFRIRLIDIDCFEGTKSSRAAWQAQKYNLDIEKVVEGGNLAGEILKQKLENKKITFEFMGIDKYNRALGVLYADNKNVNKEMLKTNYCMVYKK